MVELFACLQLFAVSVISSSRSSTHFITYALFDMLKGLSSLSNKVGSIIARTLCVSKQPAGRYYHLFPFSVIHVSASD